ncbi:MFS transporter [Companilactobacillus nodensis]|uniref:Major facilitator superfamily protein n=1 Tax=Companilactobacillus nodensis DSM 19682 = JCM 14932 = NBRC 107160 TaxID=1423775 RepID=A0A0R1KIW2_9LACO|nr:MFS transporter [Companilactobacillus nodensis]KRK78951.1 major facilitator superfamily protein [Companilactobacillus nodensis DSM 19682 = JCM 14932 = NBRC 107160]
MSDNTFAIPNWRKNIYLFLFGQFMSGITSMVVQYAIIWYLTKETGSATVLSFATLLGMLPMVLLSPFVGPFVDRTNKKFLLIVPDIIAAIFAIILSIVGIINKDFPLWLIFVSLLVRSIAQTFQMPTIQSIMPTMVPKEQITKMNGQLGMVQSANMIIAPALGAFLFSIVPIAYLILLDVVGAIVGVVIIMFVIIPENPVYDEKIHVLSDVKFGLDQLRGNRGLWYITLMGTAFTLLFMPAASMYPLMTMSYFHGTVAQAGIIEVVYSVGMLAGGAVIGFFGNWSDRMKPILNSIWVMGISFAISGVLPGNSNGFLWFVALNTIAGLATPFFNTLLMAMIQESYPPENLGRVLGILNSLMSISGPVGLVFAGPLADKFGVNSLFIIGGIGTLLCGLFVLLVPVTRNYDKELQKKIS